MQNVEKICKQTTRDFTTFGISDRDRKDEEEQDVFIGLVLLKKYILIEKFEAQG